MLSLHRIRRFFGLILLLLVAWPVQALERGPQGTVRVGIFPVEPLSFIDNQGASQGLYPDLLREIVKDEKWVVEYVPGSWAEGLERLQKGEIDLMLSVAYSPQRAEIMDFTYESVVELWGQVFVSPQGSFKNIQDLDGHRVAVMRRDITGSNFAMTAEKLGVRCEIVEYATHAEVFSAVSTGDADAGVAPQHIGLRQAKEYNLVGSAIIFSPFSVFFASKKGMQHELLSHIDSHISSWKKDPDSYYYHRLNYWIGGQNSRTKIPVWLIYASIFGGFTILLFGGFTVLLKRTVSARTKELQESELTFRKLFEDSSDAILLIDGKGFFVECNQAALDLLKMTREQFLFLPPARISPEFQPDGRPSAEAAPEMIALAYSKGIHRFDWTCVNAEGSEFIVEVSLMPVTIKGQTMLHNTWRDITTRKQAEIALRESGETFRNIVHASPMGIHLYELQNADRLVFVGTNPAADKLLGVDNKKFIGMTIEQAFPPLQHTNVPSRYRRAAEFGESWHTEQIDYDHDTIAGAFEVYAFQMSLGKVAVLFNDITERKRAEKERERLQMQLTQAQRIEAVGQLAGGVAHDFNNMLGVIIGYTDMILEQADPSQQFHAEVLEIQKAAQRSAELTRQLLTYARKQTVVPRVLDLNRTIEGMLNMLRRLIGENIDLIWMPGSGLWPINMDPSQIDQILANLCVNARDAIVGVGKLTVETRNVTFDKNHCATHAGAVPGEYAQIALSDTGSGMDKETLAHIFEPFFTTKAVGEGTGLGLATVYGAVKQNDGFISAHSEPGQGTTFTISIPRHIETDAKMREAAATKPAVCGNEIVLLVEDEPKLLHISKTMLERLGYKVLAAVTPSTAIGLADEYSGEIHLLATDVIMPEMNGLELSARLKKNRPEMKCLFMSGYTANIIAKQGMLEEGVFFIQKPFSTNELALKIREVLEH